MIVKVQWPLSTNHKVPQVLIYNRDRTIEQIFDGTPDLKAAIGPSCKAYFHARINQENMLVLLDRAPDQPW